LPAVRRYLTLSCVAAIAVADPDLPVNVMTTLRSSRWLGSTAMPRWVPGR